MNPKKLLFILFILALLSCQSEKFITADGKEMEITPLVGMDVFDLAYEYCAVGPETLMGTNNQRWVVYYSDIDITLVTDKATNIVLQTEKGKKPKSNTWAD